MTQLWVGLGNPGTQYADHRHNVGFQFLDALANSQSVTWSNKFKGQLAQIILNDEKIYLLKPETFMNRSGQSVNAALTFFKMPIQSVTVFHDELDIENAKLKIKSGGGHGGHNGLRDIDAHCGKDYRRYRIGIDHPGFKDAVSSYVLHNFTLDQRIDIDRLIEFLVEKREMIAANRDGKLQTALALHMQK